MSVLKEHRTTFFTHLFGDMQGYLTIATIKNKVFNRQYFFKYPGELKDALEYIEAHEDEYNTYFSAQLFRSKARRKDNIEKCNFLWADLDECHPNHLLIEPTIVLETSKNRYQAFWKLTEEVDPEIAEDLSKRIAYKHVEQGADEGGWDLSQLLRVPLSSNYNHGKAQPVLINVANRNTYDPQDVAKLYPQVEKMFWLEEPAPSFDKNINVEGIFTKIPTSKVHVIRNLYETVPEDDWSKPLWNLLKCLVEVGLTKQEAFFIAYDSQCNKYKRDGRPHTHLWRDVLKAYANVSPPEEEEEEEEEVLDLELLTEDERKQCADAHTLIEKFIEYGSKATDSDIIYHKANIFMVLSCLLSSKLRIEIDQTLIAPNLWLIILGESTYTRKSTALNLAKQFVDDIDPDCLLATDASPQGILDGLSTRPNRNTLFFRDEFQGLIKAICKSDYMTGMTETFTSLYNGDNFKRKLSKTEITVRKPIFILWGGGIKEEIMSHLTNDNVTSGFIPRFLFVTGYTDISKIRLRGKKSADTSKLMNSLHKELAELYNFYNNTSVDYFRVELTDDAVELMNRVEAHFLSLAFNDNIDISPALFDRALVSGIKMAGLIAATRKEAKKGVLFLERSDMQLAFYYLEQFIPFSVDVVNNIGITISERQVQRALMHIGKSGGITRSKLMKVMRLESRRTDEIIKTLQERNHIILLASGRGTKITLRG